MTLNEDLTPLIAQEAGLQQEYAVQIRYLGVSHEGRIVHRAAHVSSWLV